MYNALQSKAHQLLDRLDSSQLISVVTLLEEMIEDEQDELTEEDRHAISTSREYFRQNPEGGLSLEQVATDCSFTMDQVLNHTME